MLTHKYLIISQNPESEVPCFCMKGFGAEASGCYLECVLNVQVLRAQQAVITLQSGKHGIFLFSSSWLNRETRKVSPVLNFMFVMAGETTLKSPFAGFFNFVVFGLVLQGVLFPLSANTHPHTHTIASVPNIFPACHWPFSVVYELLEFFMWLNICLSALPLHLDFLLPSSANSDVFASVFPNFSY